MSAGHDACPRSVGTSLLGGLLELRCGAAGIERGHRQLAFCIVATESASSFGASVRMRCSHRLRGGRHGLADRPRSILFQVAFVMTVRADERRHVQVEHVRRRRKICSASAPYGGLGAASIMPRGSLSCAEDVVLATSAAGGSRSRCTTAPSCRRPGSCRAWPASASSSVWIGFFEKSCTQPALPQLSRWKPLASRRCSITGPTRLEHVVQFGIGLEEERHAEDVDARIDLRQTRWPSAAPACSCPTCISGDDGLLGPCVPPA